MINGVTNVTRGSCFYTDGNEKQSRGVFSVGICCLNSEPIKKKKRLLVAGVLVIQHFVTRLCARLCMCYYFEHLASLLGDISCRNKGCVYHSYKCLKCRDSAKKQMLSYESKVNYKPVFLTLLMRPCISPKMATASQHRGWCHSVQVSHLSARKPF